MIAYNKEQLHGLYTREQADEAFSKNCIDKETHTALTSLPTGLYTPNIFVRIGLALLTIIIALFSCALFFLMSGLDRGISILMTVCGVLSYVALELLVSNKKHYNSGVDNVLMIAIPTFIATAVSFAMRNEGIASSSMITGLCFLVCSFLSYRFTDAFMAAAATVLFNMSLIFVTSTFLPLAALPVLAIVACLSIYIFTLRSLAKGIHTLFEFTMKGIALTALILLYLSGNVFVVDNVISMDMLERMPLIHNAPIVIRFLFWTWTLLLPVVYIAYGIRKKDIVLIRTGIILCTFAIFTYRTYFSILSIEAAMIIGGGVMVILSYILIKFLKTPKHRFTFDPPPAPVSELNVEDLITERLINRATQQ